jgi:hypothetical protein
MLVEKETLIDLAQVQLGRGSEACQEFSPLKYASSFGLEGCWAPSGYLPAMLPPLPCLLCGIATFTPSMLCFVVLSWLLALRERFVRLVQEGLVVISAFNPSPPYDIAFSLARL